MRSIDPRARRVRPSVSREGSLDTHENIDLSQFASTRRKFSLSSDDGARFLRIVSDAQLVRRHCQLFAWLNGEVQTFLPHKILISAWGDFATWDLKLDIVSALPGVRTEELARSCIDAFIKSAHDQWVAGGKSPLVTKTTVALETLGNANGALFDALRDMRSMLVHGVRDERSGHDSVYLALNCGPLTKGHSQDDFGHLMESFIQLIDSAFRQVGSFPLASFKKGKIHADWLDLSAREQEILDGLRHGKTNLDIAAALEISPFTVKNHVQRIFRKIGVTNRTQAATKYSQALNEITSYLEGSRVHR